MDHARANSSQSHGNLLADPSLSRSESRVPFVPAESVASLQAELDATGFDAPGATYPHQDAQGLCSFAALVRERLAHDPVLLEMADIVQAADKKASWTTIPLLADYS